MVAALMVEALAVVLKGVAAREAVAMDGVREAVTEVAGCVVTAVTAEAMLAMLEPLAMAVTASYTTAKFHTKCDLSRQTHKGDIRTWRRSPRAPAGSMGIPPQAPVVLVR